MELLTPQLDARVCERARRARDPHFDGRFFIGVTSTGIYCRPICPSPSAKRVNVRYFPTAAAAAEAGFRPCLRCRPETAPGTPAWNGTSATVSRGLKLIAEGALDEGNVEQLAARLGLSARHLHRLFLQHLGAPPVAVAQTRRLQFAKQLLDETRLPMAQVALASGFQSIRRFNQVVRKLYARTPSELRRLRQSRVASVRSEYVFHLAYRPPYDWNALLEFLAPRATPGVEEVRDGVYRRSLVFKRQHGKLEVRALRSGHALEVRIQFPEPACLLQIVVRVRSMFDLAADPAAIERHLRPDALLASSLKHHRGLRVPGAWDGFELAVRAVLGQQITVRAATTLAGRLVQSHGEPLRFADSGGLTHVFPSPRALANARLQGLPEARARTIQLLAGAVDAGKLHFASGVPDKKFFTDFQGITGIGDWTAQYVAMRAFNEPDAFPAGDLVLLRSAGRDQPLTKAALLKRAEGWRPWRAYAAMHLWRAAADRNN